MGYKTIARTMIPTAISVIHQSSGTTLSAGMFVTSMQREGQSTYAGDTVYLYVLDIDETIETFDQDSALLSIITFTEPDTDVTQGNIVLGAGQTLVGKSKNGTCNLVLTGIEK